MIVSEQLAGADAASARCENVYCLSGLVGSQPLDAMGGIENTGRCV